MSFLPSTLDGQKPHSQVSEETSQETQQQKYITYEDRDYLFKLYKTSMDNNVPDIVARMGLYSLISACMTGRYRYDNFSVTQQTWPNLYVLFVGLSGAGKSTIIKHNEKILNTTSITFGTDTRSPAIRTSPTTGTVEGFIKEMSRGDVVWNKLPPVKLWNRGAKKYDYHKYTPMHVMSHDLQQLIHKENRDSFAKFLTPAWDAKENLVKAIKGDTDKEIINNVALSMAAGTTFDKLPDLFNPDSAGDGLLSRIHIVLVPPIEKKSVTSPEVIEFILANPDATPEDFEKHDKVGTMQKEKAIIELGKWCQRVIFGSANVTPKNMGVLASAHKFMLEEQKSGKWVVNPSHLLTSYYERKQFHWNKLSLVHRFTYSTEPFIEFEDYAATYKVLGELEGPLDQCFCQVSNNPTHRMAARIMAYVKGKKGQIAERKKIQDDLAYLAYKHGFVERVIDSLILEKKLVGELIDYGKRPSEKDPKKLVPHRERAVRIP